MGAIAMRIRSKKGIPAVQRGLASLRKYGTNVHFWTAGTGWLNGVQAANYLDSAGTNPGSVDNPIGLVLDLANASTGPNLVSNGGLTTDISGWTSANSPVTSNGANGVTVQKNGASDGQLTQVISTVVGQGYKISCVVTNPTNNYIFGVTGTNTGYQATPGRITLYFTASSTSTTVVLQQGGSSGAATTFGQVSLQAISGIPASQATTANKPVLRRGVTNLFSYSNAFTNAAWATVGSPVLTTGQKDPFGGNGGTLYARTTTGSTLLSNGYSKSAAAQPFTSFFVVSAGTGRYFALRTQGSYPARADVVFDLQAGTVFAAPAAFSGFSGASASMAPLGNGFWLVCLSATTDASTAVGAFVSPSSNGIVVDGTDSAANSTCYVYAGGLAAGTLTAQQILQCGGIPTTTTAPVSSVAGNWGWQFGVSNYLSLASVPFQMTDDHAVIAGVRPESGAGYQSIFAINGVVTNPKIEHLEFGGGNLNAYWQDDSGAAQILQTGYSLGVPIVATGARRSNTAVLRVNGVQKNATGPAGLGTTTVTTATIGARGFGPSNWLIGQEFACVAIKGFVSDADILAIERLIGVLTGPTGVTF